MRIEYFISSGQRERKMKRSHAKKEEARDNKE